MVFLFPVLEGPKKKKEALGEDGPKEIIKKDIKLTDGKTPEN